MPQPPPVPVENERVRRRRKLREYLREEAPGLEIEKGVDQVSHFVPTSLLIQKVDSTDLQRLPRRFH